MFALENLAACSKDILAWRRAGRLGDGAVLRELARLCEAYFPDPGDALAEAGRLVVCSALERCAAASQQSSASPPNTTAP